jgi:hypothetical protein
MKFWGQWRGRHQLRIGPIITSPKGEAGAGFEQVAKTLHGRVRTHYRRRPPFFPGGPRLPMLAGSQSEEVASLVESTLPGLLGKLLALLIRRTDRPRYSIEGVMHSDIYQQHSALSLSLMREGEPLQSWDRRAPVGELAARHRGVAFAALRRLVREMSR